MRLVVTYEERKGMTQLDNNHEKDVTSKHHVMHTSQNVG